MRSFTSVGGVRRRQGGAVPGWSLAALATSDGQFEGASPRRPSPWRGLGDALAHHGAPRSPRRPGAQLGQRPWYQLGEVLVKREALRLTSWSLIVVDGLAREILEP